MDKITKICTKCDVEKRLDDFPKSKLGKFGTDSRCKKCRSNYYYTNKIQSIYNSKRYYNKYRSDIITKAKEYYDNNKVKINKHSIERRKADQCYKICCNLRIRVWKIIKHNQKSCSAVKDLGCTVSELRQHLESKFQIGMSWDNYGVYGWHIDHVIPLSSFDLTDQEQFKKACHYTNLQPLWAIDNIKKGNKIPQ